MGYRGRTLQQFLAKFYRLDLPSMGADDKLDPDYNEPTISATTDRKGDLDREEMTAVMIPAQIEPDSFQRMMMRELGDTKSSVFAVTIHFADLEDRSLVDAATGLALIRPSDRLGAIYELDGTTLVHTFPNPPGMFVTEATPTFGIGRKRNLLLVRMQSRG